MKKRVLMVLFLALFFFAPYLMISFTYLSFDASKLSEDARGYIAFVSPLSMAIGFSVWKLILMDMDKD